MITTHPSSIHIKLTTTLLVILPPLGYASIAAMGLLLALLNAAQTVPPEQQPRRSCWLPQFLAVLRQFINPRFWPFYVALLGIVWLDHGGLGSGSEATGGRGGWGSAAVAGHGPGASTGLCACGKPIGHDKTSGARPGGSFPATPSATPPPSAAETAARLEKLKQRSMIPPPARGASQLPGIGPNAKPLPPGLEPNPNAVVPK